MPASPEPVADDAAATEPPDFDRFMARAWEEHAAQPEAVAERLALLGPGLAATPQQLGALAHLVHHLEGEHLGRFELARERLGALAGHPATDTATLAALRRYDAALALALEHAREDGPAAPAALPDGLPPSDRIRVGALAASSLAARRTDRALALLEATLAEAASAGLADADPAHRTLAVTAHNLACELEDKRERTPGERALMVRAAQASRRHWARAGGWLETERAEYRLAMSWLAAGDPDLAAEHAGLCRAIVEREEAPALEHFFAWEASGLAARARHDWPGHGQALAKAEGWFERLDPADRGWCAPALDRLRG